MSVLIAGAPDLLEYLPGKRRMGAPDNISAIIRNLEKEVAALATQRDELQKRIDTAMPVAEGGANIDGLVDAAKALYFAGYWHCDRPVDEQSLWIALRSAAGIAPGQTGAVLGQDRTEPTNNILKLNVLGLRESLVAAELELDAAKRALAEAIERCARVCEKRAELRFEENGTYEPDTGASYYGGRCEEEYTARDEEDYDCATAIRALAAKSPLG